MPGGSAAGDGTSSANADLIAFLTTNRGSATWLAATTGSGAAAPIQLASGEPVMAIGGFNGGDPAPTLDEFVSYATSGAVRYYVVSGGGGGGGGEAAGSSEIQAWIEANGTAVDTASTGGVTVYDLSAVVG